MRIVVFGPKGAGKSSVGSALATRLGLPVLDTDALIEKLDATRNNGTARSCRDIFRSDGEEAFRALEREAAAEAAKHDWSITITGGGLMMDPDSRRALRDDAILLYLFTNPDTLWERATEGGLPPWLEGDDGPAKFAAQNAHRDEVLRPFADIVFDTAENTPEEQADLLAEQIGRELSIRMNSPDTMGDVLRMTCFGESHGRAIGVVVDGLKPGIEFDAATVQEQLDRRRPGQSKVVTQRKELDEVDILAGVFEGKTTGAPLAMVIYNKDQRSKNYDDIKDVFRPGHGDFTFYKKYGFRDYRGGGRQSGRETACRVAAGAVPLAQLKKRGVKIVAYAAEVAGIKAKTCDFDVIENNPVRAADPDAAKRMEEAILAARSDRDSVGGVVQLEIHGLPVGLGDPIFGKLDARLINGIMTIGAIKGVEVGGGFSLTRLRGSQANDLMHDGKFLSNHAGGILGGISNGAPVVIRVAVKPTASIASKQPTCDEHGKNIEIEVLGRHDPCIVPRAVPVIECMAAFVIADAWAVQERLNPEWAAQHPLW